MRSAYGKLAGKVGIVCNVLLCIGKFIAGIISGSLSISADALNNLSDASSSIIRTIGSPMPSKIIFDCVLPPDIPLSKPEIEEAVTRRLQEKFPEYEAVITFDEGYAGIPKSSAEK